MKLRSIVMVVATLTFGVSACFMLVNELGERSETPVDRDLLRFQDLERERQSLKEQLALFEDRGIAQEPVKKGVANEATGEVEKIKGKIKVETARNKQLQDQVRRLKAELPEDSPSALVAKYLKLVTESQTKSKDLSSEELAKWRAKQSRDMMPLIMGLMTKPDLASVSILNALQDPKQKHKDQLTTLLPMLFISQKLNKDQADSFNKQVIAISLDEAMTVQVRQATLSELQLDEETESRRDIANTLVEIVRDQKNPLREEAIVLLAKLPYNDTQNLTRTLILDSNEPAALRRLAYVHSRGYERPGGEGMTLRLMKDSDKELRGAAYENARFIKNASGQVLQELENALVDEKVESLFESIAESLEDLGSSKTAETLKRMSEDPSRSLKVRTQAENCRKVIIERLKD